MNKKTKQVQAWKFLMEQVKGIQDPLLKRSMIADFRERAKQDWGWDPATGNLTETATPELNEWEKDFLERVKLGQQLGVYVPGDTDEVAEARVNMMEYVRDGGTLAGIPDDIRTPDIEDLYWECRHALTDELLQQADNVMPKRIDPPIDEPELIGDILPRVLNELKIKAEARNDKATND